MYFRSVNNFRDILSKHGPLNGGPFESTENSRNQHNPNTSTMVNKYHSVDARYHSIKNLPPDLRMKLRETVRQKMDNNESANTYMVNNSNIQPSPTYKVPPYIPNADQNGVGKMAKASDVLNPYKSPPFNEAFYQVTALKLLVASYLVAIFILISSLNIFDIL